MAYRQGHFAVRGVSVPEMPEALLASSAHAPDDAAYERFSLSAHGPWTAALMLDGYGHVHRWAQAVSFERKVVAVSIFVLEGCWDYSVFDRGEYVVGTQFYPLERPVLHGDAVRAAALLGCDADVFRRYHDAIVAACDDPEEEYPHAYDDDEYPAADEYGFHSFARRIGVPGDPFSESDPLGIRAPGDRPEAWQGLPGMPF